MGIYVKAPHAALKKGFEGHSSDNNKSQLIEKSGLRIMPDAYNANPTSMKAALEAFAQSTGNHRTVLLGDMFELGNSADEEYQIIANIFESVPFQSSFLVGKYFYGAQTKLPEI